MIRTVPHNCSEAVDKVRVKYDITKKEVVDCDNVNNCDVISQPDHEIDYSKCLYKE